MVKFNPIKRSLLGHGLSIKKHNFYVTAAGKTLGTCFCLTIGNTKLHSITLTDAANTNNGKKLRHITPHYLLGTIPKAHIVIIAPFDIGSTRKMQKNAKKNIPVKSMT
jgi:hypothetical protein